MATAMLWREEQDEAPIVGALAPWFGGKRTMAPAITGAIGPHLVYWEPFAGSMAVLLAKPRCRTEVVNDLHGDLVNLARTIQDPREGPALYRRLRRVLFSEAEFRAAVESLDGEGEGPDRAFRYFVASWQGMNGKAGTDDPGRTFARRYTSTGGDPATRWVGAVRSIPAWRRRLERVQVLRSDGFALLAKIEDREGTAIYCDPPYLAKGAKYLHDFADADHDRLASLLARFRRTRVVLSYYDSPRLDDLYPGWEKRPVRAGKGLSNASKRDGGGVTEAAEVLLINPKGGD